MHPLCCWNLSDWIRSDKLVKVSCFLMIICASCAICESSSGLKICEPQSTWSTLKMCCCLCLIKIDQFCPLGSIGATTFGVCIHCHAGTYQTGSGQMQWWWVDWLLILICWYLWALCIVYNSCLACYLFVSTGASMSGACNLCPPGTYQTGSGWMLSQFVRPSTYNQRVMCSMCPVYFKCTLICPCSCESSMVLFFYCLF